MTIGKDVIQKICEHAMSEYPYECCGIITGSSGGQTAYLCENIQNRLHAENPREHPRDARTAYMIDRKEFDSIITAAMNRGEEVIAFYHSHVDHDAYFSATDVAAQTVLGEPEFPSALQIVLSVRKGEICDMKCFQWNETKSDFVPVALSKQG